MLHRKSASKRGYNSRWQKCRIAYLCQHPLCSDCDRRGLVTPATVVDHIVPHKGDPRLFWDEKNWQSLCDNCHNSYKQALEHGVVRGADLKGLPLDPRHGWATEGDP